MNSFFRSKPFKRARNFTLICFLALVILGSGIALWYGGPSAPLSNEGIPGCCSLTLGDHVSLKQVVRDTGYKPLWLGIEGADVSVSVCDKDGEPFELEDENVLSYQPDAKELTAVGVGEGFITFTSNVDNAVSFTVPFKVSYKSQHTSKVLQTEYADLLKDGVLTDKEIAGIESITIKDVEVDAADLAAFGALKTIKLDCPTGVPKMTNQKIGWEYFVPMDKYEQVMASADWQAYDKYVFLDVNKAADKIEVMFDPKGGTFDDLSSFEDTPTSKGFYICLVSPESELEAKDFVPQKLGYTFNTWMIYGNEMAGIAPAVLPATSTLTENLKVYAEWNEHSYMVKFDVNGGSGAIASTTLKYSEKFTPNTSSVKRDGYDFMGWSTTPSGDVRFAAGEPIVSLSAKDSDEITLYAVWRADVYNVEFYDGMELLGSKKNIGYFDPFQVIAYTAPSKLGMTFLGWSRDATATTPEYSSTTQISRLTDEYGATVKIYTVWDAIRYSVSYDANGGVGAPQVQTLKYNDIGTIPSTVPTRYGYTFKGWGAASSSTKISYSAGDTYINLRNTNGAVYTMYAVWEPDQFAIKFNAEGATGGSSSTRYVDYGSPYSISVNTFSKEGYYIAGWSTTPNSSTVEYSSNRLTTNEVADFYERVQSLTNKTIDLYPVWKGLSYKIKLDLQGGTTSSNTSATLSYTQGFSLPTPKKDYYSFGGWVCDFDMKTYSAGTTITGSKFEDLAHDDVVTFRAKWTLAQYDVKYSLDGGSGVSSNTFTYSVEDSVTLAGAPTKEGYTFKGWKSSVDGNVYSAGQTAKNWAESSQSKVIFTAQWEKNA